ncbi:ABC transporter ATP-binding protein [Gulosibacter chungangensis]|uniref:sn-glycerol-3-phosphate ABC transporter ATP-binding protein UgpC n=1 Tax=Gulosibacter chungangensis TaxID=979746 RepID=A0A7J5BC21_9MICO|nr:sn-glycerol-3-phosphate ABC transporter ATP-binding protein UgpC [Gulosibacter chungangensis]KAB1643098.1 sn-glycerol-3-phosphate ABC transporter ATP-binding protein UgpC [Gulosibacter chungangensis]
MATVTFRGVTRRFHGTTRNAVDRFDLEIGDGEFLVMVGPSGCGKTTTLRMLAGLEPVDSGSIHIGERDVTNVPPKDRDMAMVFQSYGLYPHMTVEQNIGFPLRTSGMPKAQRAVKVREAVDLLGLGELLHRRPGELSGGQRQRVAMGRAIVREPQVFLMDEPLSNLDAKLRVQTRTQIASLQNRLGVTTVYVTHDQTEAMTMGDRIAVLNHGKLQQVGAPQELYDAPANEFVASFIGSPAMTIWSTRLRGGMLDLGGASTRVPDTVAQLAGDREVRVGLRAEDFAVAADGETGLRMRVDLVEELGSDGYLYGRAALPGGELPLTVRVDGRHHAQIGDTVTVLPNTRRLHLFDAATGERL